MKLFKYILLLFPLLLLSACSDDKDPSSTITLYDIVKLEMQDEKGSTFTLQKPEATETVMYTCNQLLDNELVPVGNRLLLAYIPESGKAYESGRIRVVGYMPITNLEMIIGDTAEIEGWDASPIYLLSIWRSGGYINMRASMPYLDKARKFGLVLDKDSSDPKHPDLYLYHDMDDDQGTFDRTYYISFDIQKLFEDADIKGITVHVNNSNLPEKVFDFDF